MVGVYNFSRAGLAQLVEHPPCKRKVFGSIPKAGTSASGTPRAASRRILNRAAAL